MKGSSGRSASSRSRKPQVALELPQPQGRVLVAGVLDGHVRRRTHGRRPGGQGRQDLLVNAVRPAQLRLVAEQPDVVHDRGGAVAGVGQAQALHRVGSVVILQAGEERPAAGGGCPRRGGRRRRARRSSRPVACRRLSLRAAAKLSTQGKSKTRAPKPGNLRVRSVEPVSTTMTSSTRSAAEPRQAGRLSSSFRTIMHSDTCGRRPAAGGRRLAGGQAVAGGLGLAPLPAEEPEVVLQLAAAVHAQRGEGAAAEVVDEHVLGGQQRVAGPACPGRTGRRRRRSPGRSACRSRRPPPACCACRDSRKPASRGTASARPANSRRLRAANASSPPTPS